MRGTLPNQTHIVIYTIVPLQSLFFDGWKLLKYMNEFILFEGIARLGKKPYLCAISKLYAEMSVTLRSISRLFEAKRETGEGEAATIKEFLRKLPPITLHLLESTNEIQPNNPHQLNLLLIRYFRAEKKDLGRAISRLDKHASWRSRYIPDGSIHEVRDLTINNMQYRKIDGKVFPYLVVLTNSTVLFFFLAKDHTPNCNLQDKVINQIRQQKVFLQPPSAKDGKPLLIIKVGNHQPIHDIHEVENFVIYCLEAASKLCDNSINQDGKMWALFDLNNVKWKNLDNSALRACFHLLNLAYPERVQRIFMLDSHFLFDSLWRVVKPFIDPVSRQKVCFVYGAEGRKNMMKYVDPNTVPTEYGGLSDLMPVEKAMREIVPHVDKLFADVQPNEDREEEKFFDCCSTAAGSTRGDDDDEQ